MEGEVPEVAVTLRQLFGNEQELRASGVLHVCSAVRREDGELRVLKIGPDSPPSESDFFLLNLARARADAILTTAAIVRAEPELSMMLSGPHAVELACFRRERLDKSTMPLVAIMTRDGDLPREHALWQDGMRKLVLTEPARVQTLSRELEGLAEVVGLNQLDARIACAFLRERGAQLISVEAGPRANAALYQPPAMIDELSLSLYEGTLEGVALGGALSESLLAGMVCAADATREESSGTWRYQRWLRS